MTMNYAKLPKTDPETMSDYVNGRFAHIMDGEYSYQDDPDAMLALVEFLKEHDFWLSVVFKEVRAGEAEYFARFRCVRGATRGDHGGSGDTIPEAVLEAAYRLLATQAKKGWTL